MAFLTGRMLMWVSMSAAALGVVAALYLGAVNKGKRINDEKWRAAVSQKVEQQRNVNHQINMDTLEREAELARRKSEIIEKWSEQPSQ